MSAGKDRVRCSRAWRGRRRIADILPHDGPGVWVPPVAGRHRYGYLLVTASYASLDAVAQSRDVLSVHPAERASRPLNDHGVLKSRADLVHAGLPIPYQGNGVIIAILDSSLDIAHPDIPEPVEAYDVC